MKAEPILSLENVSKVFHSRTGPVEALRCVNLRVRPGECVAVMGASGAGKSTLLNLIGMLDRPSSGSCFVGGIEVSMLSERLRRQQRASLVGFIFQEYHLLPDRTAEENVALGLLYGLIPRRERLELSRKLLAEVGLADRTEAYPATLSGGEKQRVAIARALGTGAQLLLCDEPTGNLDRKTGSEIMELLLGQRDAGRGVLIVTHSRRAAEAADSLYILEGGELLEA